MRYIIYPYKMGSQSGRDLARELGALRVYPDRNYRPRQGDIIINWGSSRTPDWVARAGEVGAWWLNMPPAVRVASNKLRTFQALRNAGVRIPRFTESDEVAVTSFEGHFARESLTANSGYGCHWIPAGSISVEAPLYTEEVPNGGEYRVHVFQGEVISYAKKHRREDNPVELEFEDKIRSYGNGWIFCRENLRRLERIEQIAIDAVQALGLQFAGVDIVKHADTGEPYIIEVNTACGLQGQTLEAYVNAIRNYASIQ